ncbi:MAG: hypothetical protein ACK48U_03780, partial [Planctomyces sp.]
TADTTSVSTGTSTGAVGSLRGRESFFGLLPNSDRASGRSGSNGCGCKALIERLPDHEELGNARPAPHSRRLRQRWDTEFSKHSNRTSNREPRGKTSASHKS